MSDIKGIIFDMDNTILRSKINFRAMKGEIYDFLISHRVLPTGLNLEDHTTATVIELAKQSDRLTEDLTQEMWQIASRHELLGMQDADLEPGVKELLHRLKGKYVLTVVTNNSIEAAITALRDNGILEDFDSVIGREMMTSIKPSPDGFLYVLNQYPHIEPGEWLAVGDSWIDGKGAAAAGITFIAYRGDEDLMSKMGVYPQAHLNDIIDLWKYV